MLASNAHSQQAHISKVWQTNNGHPGQYDYVSTELDPNGNLVYITNHTSNGNSDIFLNCIQPNGNVAWQHSCPSSPI